MPDAFSITIRTRSEYTAEQWSASGRLNDAVYSPAVVANWPGRVIEWSRPTWHVLVWNVNETETLANASLQVRTGLSGDVPVTIGGIGGVMTHPQHRHQGYARAAIAAGLDFFRSLGTVDFGLLVCEPALVALYEHLGWQCVPGTLWVTQHGQRVPFTFNQALVYAVNRPFDLSGEIDLCGPPW